MDTVFTKKKSGVYIILLLLICSFSLHFSIDVFAESVSTVVINATAKSTLNTLPMKYHDTVARLADKWLNEPSFFEESPIYRPYIVNDILIYGFGSSPSMYQGENLLYFNYSEPTVFFLPQNHRGGKLYLYLFYHGDRIVPKVEIALDDKMYTLVPKEATDEYIYNTYLEKRPVFQPGLALTLDCPPEKNYVKLQTDNKDLLFAAVEFIEYGPKKISSVTKQAPVAGSSKSTSTDQSLAVQPETSKKPTTAEESNVGSYLLSDEGLVLVTSKTKNIWPRYTNKKLGFSIAYPEGWSYFEGDEKTPLELRPPKGEKRVIITRDSLGNKNLSGFVSEMEGLLGMETTLLKELSLSRVQHSAFVSIGKETYYFDILYVKVGSYVYTITAVAPEANKDDYQEEISDILSSFSSIE